MSVKRGRLDRLYPGLTAKERAILVLQAWKRDEDEDPQVRLTMPESQGADFNHYIDLMNGVYDLTPYVIVLHQQVAQLGLKFAWLSTFHLWGLHTSTLAEYICFYTKEPITESDHKRRVEEARSKAAPIAELAEVLLERYDGWEEDDLQASEDDEEPEVSDKAWNHVCYTETEQPIEDALAAFMDGVAAVYRLRPDQGYDRWFPRRPEVSNITTVSPYKPLLLLMSESTVWAQQPTMLLTSASLTQGWNSVCYTGTAKSPEGATSSIAEDFAILYMFGSDGAWSRYVPGRPEVSNVAQLERYDTVLMLATEPGGTIWTFDP